MNQFFEEFECPEHGRQPRGVQETAESLNCLALSCARKGWYEETVACLRKGLGLSPFNGLLWLNLALGYYALKRTVDSAGALYHALRCTPHHAAVWNMLGVVLHDMGDTEASRNAYEHAIRLETKNGATWNNYGLLLHTEQKYDQAQRAFETALSLLPRSGSALYNLSRTYHALGDARKAAVCRRILAQMPAGEKKPGPITPFAMHP